MIIPVEKEKVPVVRGRYYGRGKRVGDDSESELSVDDDDDDDDDEDDSGGGVNNG